MPVCECQALTGCGCLSALVPSPIAADSSFSFARSPPAPQRPLPRGSWLCGRWETPVGGLGATEPIGASLPASPPALPRSGPAPAASRSRAESAGRPAERTAAGAHSGDPAREPSGGSGRPGGGRRGRAVETPGPAGRAKLVSAAAGCQKPESGHGDSSVPCPPCPGLCARPPPSIPALPLLGSSSLCLCRVCFPCAGPRSRPVSFSSLLSLSPAASVFPVLSQALAP